MQTVDERSNTNQGWYQINHNRPLFISAQREDCSCKPALNKIHVDLELTERLLSVLAGSSLIAQKVTSKQVFSDKVVNGILKGVVETVITVWMPNTDGRMVDLCALLSNHNFHKISDIIRHEWQKEGLVSISFSGYK